MLKVSVNNMGNCMTHEDYIEVIKISISALNDIYNKKKYWACDRAAVLLQQYYAFLKEKCQKEIAEQAEIVQLEIENARLKKELEAQIKRFNSKPLCLYYPGNKFKIIARRCRCKRGNNNEK